MEIHFVNVAKILFFKYLNLKNTEPQKTCITKNANNVNIISNCVLKRQLHILYLYIQIALTKTFHNALNNEQTTHCLKGMVFYFEQKRHTL